MPRVGSFHRATTRDGGRSVGPRALDHAERGERQHRRTRVVGEHAGVACGPARGQLRPVEEDGQHERRANRAEQVGDGVEAGEVLAHDGDDRDPSAELEELDRPARDLHRLPPAQPRVEGAAEVVLQHLALVERPAMVLVLAVVPPSPAELDAEVHPVAGQRGRSGVEVSRTPAISTPTPWRASTASRSPITSVGHGALGKHDHVDDVDLVEGLGQHVGRRGRGRLVLPGRTRRSRTAPARRAGPTPAAVGSRCRATRSGQGSSRRLAGWRRGSRPRTLGRDLVPHRVDAGTAHAGVAGERAQRDAAGGGAHLGQHAQTGPPDAGQRTGAGEQLAAATAHALPGAAAALDGDAHAGACLVGDGVQGQQRRADRPVVAFGDRLERRAGAVAHGRPGVGDEVRAAGRPVAGRLPSTPRRRRRPRRPSRGCRAAASARRPEATRRTGRPRTARGRPRSGRTRQAATRAGRR